MTLNYCTVVIVFLVSIGYLWAGALACLCFIFPLLPFHGIRKAPRFQRAGNSFPYFPPHLLTLKDKYE